MNRQELHHYRFLLAVLDDCGPATLQQYVDNPDWDWATLTRIASDERILPLLYNRLHGIAAGPEVERLREIRELHAERNKQILDELGVVAGLANEIGITPVLLKGIAHLVAGMYPSLSDRYLFDIDLLVPEGQMEALVEHLRRNGYSSDPGCTVGVDCHHAAGLRRAGRPVIEVHRSLGMGRARRLLSAGEVARDSVAITHRGCVVRLPSDRHLLLHHAVHAQAGNSYRMAVWPGLREAYDCRLLVARWLGRRRETGVVDGILAVHLRTVEAMTGRSFGLESGAGRWQWLHRRWLRAMPWARFIDPYYLLRSSLLPRLQRMRDLLGTRAGVRYAMVSPFRKSFYRNVFRELF